MNNDFTSNLNNYYKETYDLWNKLCKIHSEIYDLTCDEYLKLIKSEIDELAETIVEKENLIDEVGKIDLVRKDLINRINNNLIYNKNINKNVIKTAKDLIIFFEDLPEEKENKFLNNLNELLIDIIYKTKDQNKKNQVFINKAILSINNIKQNLTGSRYSETYNSHGKTKRNINHY